MDKLEEDVMGFLNEIQQNFPDSVSLASGRPDESYFDLDRSGEYLDIFREYLKVDKNFDLRKITNELGQYNRTKGIINELIVKYLENDYGISADPDNTLISVGTQESLMLSVIVLCNKNRDVILVENPSYVGISHFSFLCGYEISPVAMKKNGVCLATLEKKILKYQSKGKRVKIVYTIPDFQNPTGIRMPVGNRKRLLELSKKYNFFIIEDNAYGDFVFDGPKYPTIKSLDESENVIYLHSFSKIIHPSLRIGVMVTGKILNEARKLIDLMSRMKGYTTVNTPSITQSILGGMLINNEFSFRNYNQAKLESLRRKKVITVEALKKYFKNSKNPFLNNVSWNSPEGGFFLTLEFPIAIRKKDMIECAKNFKVIFTPMSFFYIGNGGENEIRIAYSHIRENLIDKAIKNLAAFLSKKTEK